MTSKYFEYLSNAFLKMYLYIRNINFLIYITLLFLEVIMDNGPLNEMHIMKNISFWKIMAIF